MGSYHLGYQVAFLFFSVHHFCQFVSIFFGAIEYHQIKNQIYSLSAYSFAPRLTTAVGIISVTEPFFMMDAWQPYMSITRSVCIV